MKKIYVVIEGSGEYSDRSENPICAFENRLDADLFEEKISFWEQNINEFFRKINIKYRSGVLKSDLIEEIRSSTIFDEKFKELIIKKIDSNSNHSSYFTYREEKDYNVCEIDLEDDPDVAFNYFKRNHI